MKKIVIFALFYGRIFRYDLFLMSKIIQIQFFLSALLLTGSAFAASSPRSALVSETVFVAFDTETTGFSREKDRLVEIGAVKFRGDGEVLATTNWLVNPQREIPFYATEVHGITTKMVAQAPVFKDVWPEFAAFCGDAVLLAHNAPFDVGFLRAELNRAEIPAPAMPVIDTLPLFRKWFPHAKSHSLGKLTAELGVAGKTYHRAEADSFHIIHVLKVGMKTREGLKLSRLQQDAGGSLWLDGRTRR